MGHFQSKCPKAKSQKATTKQMEREVDTVLMTIEGTSWLCNNIWIANSGASTHITNLEVGLFDIRLIHEPVKIGNGKLVYATKVGKLCIVYAKNFKECISFILNNIQYIPDFWVNLFSLMVAMSQGSRISNEERAIIVKKDALHLPFNQEIKTKNGYICRIILAVELDNNYCFATIREDRKQDINDLHKKFGHASKAIICVMAKHYNWLILTNKFIMCESCALAKSCQKNTSKEPLT